MFILIDVERTEGLERIDDTPGIKAAIRQTCCLDGGNQCTPLIVI
jgi:hypothetical protein